MSVLWRGVLSRCDMNTLQHMLFNADRKWMLKEEEEMAVWQRWKMR